MAVLGKWCVGLCNNEVIFFRSGEVIDVLGYLALDDAAVWGLNETKGVDARERCERTNQTNVGTFRSFNGAHTSVVGRVNVTNLNTCTLTRETTGAQRRKTTLVGQTGERVVLVHEL